MANRSTSLSRVSNFAGLKLSIEYFPLERLTHPSNEVRTHSKTQLAKLARRIAEHGFVVPICVYGQEVIATGNARVRAARLAGVTEVPAVRLEHLTVEQARLVAIADNKLIEGGAFDAGALRVEIEEISFDAPGLDLGSSGFSIGERDVIFGRHRTDELADLDDASELDGSPAVAKFGDTFVCGRHRIACGDARDPAPVGAATGGQPVRTLPSDLPYNVKIAGNVSGLGERKHGEFAMASGEMAQDEFVTFLTASISATLPSLMDGALAYLFMDWRHLGELGEATKRCSLEQHNSLVWAKTSACSSMARRRTSTM